MPDEAQTRREDCRHAVLGALYIRSTGAFPAASIRTVFLKSHDFTLAEVTTACQFLTGLELVEMIPDPLGATQNFKITSKGVIEHERR